MKLIKTLGALMIAGAMALVPVSAAVATDGHERVSICHSGDGSNWTYIEPDANGWNGHKNHNADIRGLSQAECLGKNTPTPPPFDWNWTYPAPTCVGLTVTYPSDIPAGQANDVNIRIKNADTNETVTLNFHNNSGTWAGVTFFDVLNHPNWPGWTHYGYQWVQVGGTNFHWEGWVECGSTPIEEEPPQEEEPPVEEEPIEETPTEEEPPQEEEPPVEEEPIEETPTEEEPVKTPVVTDTPQLAVTGSDDIVALMITGGLMLLSGVILFVLHRRGKLAKLD